MLAVLTAAVAACVTLTLINLVLLSAVVRKLRDQPQTQSQHPPLVPQTMARGTVVRPFEATTTTGATITEESLTTTVVAFVSPSCEPCRDLVDSIRETVPRLGEPLLLVVIEKLDEATKAAVAGVDGVTVVEHRDALTISDAFGVSGYPTVARMDGRLVVDSGSQLIDVLVPVAR